ncbi:TonB family protein [Reticulomyxa filosa]|uniref:TonB family protein n=1 Tax=Reticulomyxa filosa TaxID=46433 RepID=X6NW45_RETFI|nr:TonB family protein [Reticulomyxa filosa]|eukprot:ETO30049.1 TonB family protein [Reticulomyxa filosa]
MSTCNFFFFFDKRLKIQFLLIAGCALHRERAPGFELTTNENTAKPSGNDAQKQSQPPPPPPKQQQVQPQVQPQVRPQGNYSDRRETLETTNPFKDTTQKQNIPNTTVTATTDPVAARPPPVPQPQPPQTSERPHESTNPFNEERRPSDAVEVEQNTYLPPPQNDENEYRPSDNDYAADKVSSNPFDETNNLDNAGNYEANPSSIAEPYEIPHFSVFLFFFFGYFTVKVVELISCKASNRNCYFQSMKKKYFQKTYSLFVITKYLVTTDEPFLIITKNDVFLMFKEIPLIKEIPLF